MNNNNYDRGKIKTGQESKNRYATTKPTHYKRVSSGAIIVAILALIVVICVIFAVFFEEIIPAGQFGDNNEQLPTKSPYIASEGGDDLSTVYLYSEYAILIRLSDMTTIAHQNADVQFAPASMTKVMTIVTALDFIEDLDDIYVFDPSAFDRIVLDQKKLNSLRNYASSSEMIFIYDEYLGDEEFGDCSSYTVRDLLYGISYRSGWDSVVCLIDYLGLTWDEFTSLMNSKAKEIGLENTHFGGAIGMDDEENKTTARDMAAIMAYAVKNPICKEVLGGTSYRLSYIKMTYRNRTLYNTLNALSTTPEKVLGGDYTIIGTKSGFEDKAGYCLVSCIQKNETGELFVLVTANAKKGTKYSPSENPIFDMQILFDKFQP